MPIDVALLDGTFDKLERQLSPLSHDLTKLVCLSKLEQRLSALDPDLMKSKFDQLEQHPSSLGHNLIKGKFDQFKQLLLAHDCNLIKGTFKLLKRLLFSPRLWFKWKDVFDQLKPYLTALGQTWMEDNI